jgi:hypothetical protein
MRKLALLLLGVCSFSVLAQSGGFYQHINYRSNDPFVFCKFGQINKDRCWAPVDPVTGTFVMMFYCAPPNYYSGKPWSNSDVESIFQYVSTCPQAHGVGDWKGAGTGEEGH